MSAVVDPGTFREWMAPKVAVIRALTTAIDEVPDRYSGDPRPNSVAISDLADEQRYRGRTTWELPITETHMFGAMTLRAAVDHARGFAELFDATRPPLYAHLAVARSALESAIVSWWLSDPKISSLERMKRGLCEHLYSASEVERLKLSDEARVAEWKAVADHFGWRVNVNRTHPVVDGTERPRVSDGIVTLARSDPKSPIGNLLFSRLSAVTHVTWFGVQWAIDPSGAERDERSKLATVAIGTDGAQVSAIAFYVVRVLRNAADTRFTFMGWNDEQWKSAVSEAVALEDILAQTVLNANKSPDESG